MAYWCGGGLRTQERVCATYSFLIASPMPARLLSGTWERCEGCRGFSWVGFLLMEAGLSIYYESRFGFFMVFCGGFDSGSG